MTDTTRSISYSEVQTALTCQALARHAFAYTGRLTGGQTLHRREIAARLSDGRAWGAAVAAWHAYYGHDGIYGVYDPMLSRIAAHEALRASYAADIVEQSELGIWISPEVQLKRENRLAAILDHYCSTAVQLPNLTRLEGELSTPIPSRAGADRSSNRYRFEGYIDGFTVDENGHEWIPEFKFRESLTSVALIQLSRQIRWYAWARQKECGHPVVGVIVDERLATAPKPPKIVQARRKGEGIDGRRPSHDKDQLCLPEDYVALCNEYGVYPHEDTVQSLEARRWQQRVHIAFRPNELEEAGRELVSAAKLIRDLDSGALWPIRNAQPQLCRSCRYFEACPNPSDDLYLETLYEFREPKAHRQRAESNRLPSERAARSDDAHSSDASGPVVQPPPVSAKSSIPRTAPSHSATPSSGEVRGPAPEAGTPSGPVAESGFPVARPFTDARDGSHLADTPSLWSVR